MLVIEALLLLGIWKPSHVITVIFVYNASLMGRMPVFLSEASSNRNSSNAGIRKVWLEMQPLLR